MVVQPATIPAVPLERLIVLSQTLSTAEGSKVEGPPVPNMRRQAAPGDLLSNTLNLVGLCGAPVDTMGAANNLRGNLGCGSLRPPPPTASDIPFSKRELLQVISGTGDYASPFMRLMILGMKREKTKRATEKKT